MVSVGGEELKNLSVNLKNTVHRMQVVVKHQREYDKHRGKYFFKLGKAVSEINVNEIEDCVENLISIYPEMIRATEILVKIFAHHLPRQEGYLRYLEEVEFTKASKVLLFVYRRIMETTSKEILPSLYKQLELLNSFKNGYGLKDYSQFVLLYSKEIELGMSLFDGTESALKPYKKLLMTASKAKGKMNDYRKVHPLQTVFFEMVLCFGIGAIGGIAGYLVVRHHNIGFRVFNALFSRSEWIEKTISHVYYAADWVEDAVSGINQG